MKKLFLTLFVLIALPVQAQSLNDKYGVKPKLRQGACDATSVNQMDNLLASVRLKKTTDWAVQNCEKFSTLVQIRYPDYAKRDAAFNSAMNSFLRDCYTDADLEKIIANSKPHPDCDHPAVKGAVDFVLNLMKSY